MTDTSKEAVEREVNWQLRLWRNDLAALIKALAAALAVEGWQPIETMPCERLVLVSDGALVKPATRINADTVAAPILMRLGMWTHWMPLPPAAATQPDAETGMRDCECFPGHRCRNTGCSAELARAFKDWTEGSDDAG